MMHSLLFSTCRSVALSALALVLATAIAGCGGKGVAGYCPDTAACGGDLTGVWQIGNVCEFGEPTPPLLVVPSPPAVSVPQTPALATTAPPTATVSGDWCSNLVYYATSAQQDGTKLGGGTFYARPRSLVKGTAAFLADHTYNLGTVGEAKETTHFPRSCLTAYGANPTCSELTKALNDATFANIVDMSCADASDTGCDCTYVVTESGGSMGTWRADGGTLIIYPISGGAPQPADYCVQGNTLTMGGKNGAHLNASAGTRTLTMTRCLDTDCTQLAQ